MFLDGKCAFISFAILFEKASSKTMIVTAQLCGFIVRALHDYVAGMGLK